MITKGIGTVASGMQSLIDFEDMINLAKDLGINLYSTQYTMYETCGKLYENGLRV